MGWWVNPSIKWSFNTRACYLGLHWPRDLPVIMKEILYIWKWAWDAQFTENVLNMAYKRSQVRKRFFVNRWLYLVLTTLFLGIEIDPGITIKWMEIEMYWLYMAISAFFLKYVYEILRDLLSLSKPTPKGTHGQTIIDLL